MAGGCRSTPTPADSVVNTPDGKYIVIGMCGSSDYDTKNIITSVLAEKDIPVFFTGSVVHGIHVPFEKGPEAKKLLKNDKRLKRKWIKYFSYPFSA